MKSTNYLSFIVVVVLLIINLACGGSSNTTSNNANVSNANSAPKDTSPVTVTASEFRTSGHMGRPVTISGVELREIYHNVLRMRADTVEISCAGDFNSYVPLADRVKQLRLQNKSPKGTIKGVYTKYEGGRAVIESCSLIDLEK